MHYIVDEQPSINPSYLCYVVNPVILAQPPDVYWIELINYFKAKSGNNYADLFSSIIIYEGAIIAVFTRAYLSQSNFHVHKGMKIITAEHACKLLGRLDPIK